MLPWDAGDAGRRPAGEPGWLDLSEIGFQVHQLRVGCWVPAGSCWVVAIGGESFDPEETAPPFLPRLRCAEINSRQLEETQKTVKGQAGDWREPRPCRQ